MVYCPFCAKQGVIYKAKIVKNSVQLFICDECDTVWLTEDIREDNCINYRKFMDNHGLKELWSELCDVIRL